MPEPEHAERQEEGEDPSEPAAHARLERSALMARKAAPAVGARFEAQGGRALRGAGVGLARRLWLAASWAEAGSRGVAAENVCNNDDT